MGLLTDGRDIWCQNLSSTAKVEQAILQWLGSKCETRRDTS